MGGFILDTVGSLESWRERTPFYIWGRGDIGVGLGLWIRGLWNVFPVWLESGFFEEKVVCTAFCSREPAAGCGGRKNGYMPASPQELRNNLYGSFLAHFFWLYWFIRCILHCPLTIHTARRRIGTRSAAQVCMAGAVIQASGGFLAAFSVRACPPGSWTGWCSVFAFLCWTFCMPGIRTGLYL